MLIVVPVRNSANIAAEQHHGHHAGPADPVERFVHGEGYAANRG
jgi:hypothetical protein